VKVVPSIEGRFFLFTQDDPFRSVPSDSGYIYDPETDSAKKIDLSRKFNYAFLIDFMTPEMESIFRHEAKQRIRELVNETDSM
jgi:hypothetical protein